MCDDDQHHDCLDLDGDDDDHDDGLDGKKRGKS